MEANNKLSIENILENFKDEKSKQQIKDIKKKLKQFMLKNNNIIPNSSSEFLIENEQKITSIIISTLSEKSSYFINEKENIFNYELFISFLLEKIRIKLSKIKEGAKSIQKSLFKIINKNTIKKIQSIIVNFLISFYDFYENDPSYTNNDNIIEILINKHTIIEESFLISSIKILLMINKYIEKDKIKKIFNKKVIDNTLSVKDIIIQIIEILNMFMMIKNHKESFNIGENINDNNLKNSRGYYNYKYFELLIKKTYDTNTSNFMKLLFDILFKYNKQYFLAILNNEEVSKILLISLSLDKEIRNRIIKLINKSLFIFDKNGQKHLLKIIKNNDLIPILLNYISVDLKNKKYTVISDLFEELKLLFIFSLLIYSSDDINIEKLIIQIINDNFDLLKEDKIDSNFNNFITNIYELNKSLYKYKYKILNFLLLIFDSNKNLRKIISQVFFRDINGKVDDYLEIIKNIDFFNLFINNLSSSTPEVITNFFNFLFTLDKEKYLPENEIIQIIRKLPLFTDIKTIEVFIENLKIFTDITYLTNNEDIYVYTLKEENDNFNNEKNNLNKHEDEENKKIDLNRFNKFIEYINKNEINILFDILSDIKENINSLKYKSPFDNEISLTEIVNTDYSNINEDNKKKYLSFEILDFLLNYLSKIIKQKNMFQYFISKKFLELFPFLVNDNKYKRIAYKLIKIFLISSNNEEENKEKNKEQIILILNRFKLLFSNEKTKEEDDKNKYDELYKLKELLFIIDVIKIYFNKNLIIINSNIENDKEDNIYEKIIDIYLFYPNYLNEKLNQCEQVYNDEYHSLIKQYLNLIFELICIINQNIITKNDNYSPKNFKKNIKCIIDNIIKFYSSLPDKNKYFLDIIKYLLDKSFDLYFSQDKNTNANDNNEILEEGILQENDFTLFYINKYNINPEILVDNNDNINKSIISNLCVQSPMIIVILLKKLFKYNKFLEQYLHYILFLCKINQQNIIFLLKQKLLKTLFKIIKEVPSLHDIIFQIFNLCFKYLEKEDVCFIFEQLIKLLNNDGVNNNKDFVKEILYCFTNSLRILSIDSNNYCKGIILSKYKIRQPNIYNMLEIKNLNFYDEKNINLNNNNILIKQEIFFYKSLKTKKLLLLRMDNQENINSEYRQSLKEKVNKNNYIEISFKNYEIIVSENDESIQYDDLSNYDSIFLENEKNQQNFQNYLKVDENNEIIYIFKEDKKQLYIYINGNKVVSYKYSFAFCNDIEIKIGFPLDLVQNIDDNKFKLFNHIKIKSLRIYLQKNDTKEIIKTIYKLLIGKISCYYLFAEELTNFKLDKNTKLISKYNGLYSARINSIFHKCFIKSQLHNKIFFPEILLSNSLDYLFRLEKYIFILLNHSNIDKIIFNELISLLSIYLIINENFLPKFFSKEEFLSCLYFSLYRNSKYIDKQTIENLLSFILINDNKRSLKIANKIIIDMLLDIKLFDLMNHQTKYDLINIINSKIIKNGQNIINNIVMIEKLSKILMLCQFNNKNDVDELIINIIFEIFEINPKDNIILKIVEEIIYILFNFDLYTSSHLSKYKNGRTNETYKIIYKYFNKIYNKETIFHIKELISKKINSIMIDIEIKEKLNRIIMAYNPPNLIDESNNTNNLNQNDNNSDSDSFCIKDEYNEEDGLILNFPSSTFHKIRSYSFSRMKKDNIDLNRTFTGRNDNKKLTVNNLQRKLILNKISLYNKKSHPLKLYNYDINDYSSKIQTSRHHSSIKPMDEVIIYKGIIDGESEKNTKKIFKKILKTKEEKKRRSIINIEITNEDKDSCIGDCYLCTFIKKILASIFKREIIFGKYKNYLLRCISEVFIMNKNLDFKLNFSYHLLKREGPSRIRKIFNIRVDKLLNYEYDRTAFEKRNTKKNDNSNKLSKNSDDKTTEDKSIKLDNKDKEVENENEIEKLFNFYENRKKYISENLLNFFNLGQVFNIDIVSKLVDYNDIFQEAFNCLLFKGLSYINSVLILGKNKIYILSSVNISSNNILYDAHYPISKRFWIVNNYNNILNEHCKYLNSYDINENKYNSPNDNNYNQNKKKLFEKTLKGFWLYSFYYVEINELHKRRFLHQNNSIEIFLKNGKNYYLSFNIDIRDIIVKLIINNIQQSHQSKNIAFYINNNYDSISNFQINENLNNNNYNKKISSEDINDSLSMMTYEIKNEYLMKNDNMIFIMNNNLFIDMSKKYKKNNFYKNILKKNVKKSKYSLATITDANEIIEKSYDKWTNGYLDTYSYLMILNTISGRTYNDIAQYPIYPWIISDYNSNNLDINDSKYYRDFLYPIYAQNQETRDNLKQKFDYFEDEQKEFRYHSGSHYSNAGFVCYYLIRIKPFSQLAAEVQGEFFDTTDRLFFDIESFYKVSEKYQELIPDYFNIQEIFINLNHFNLGLTTDGKNIDNVVLPPWALNSPRLFCKIMKKTLESQYVSIHINEWIDLIFGYKRKGNEAEKCCNVLRGICSGFDPKKDCENDIEIEQRINELCEMGIDPIQIFNKPHHKRDKLPKIKAFFGRKVYMNCFSPREEKYLLKNFVINCTIKEMNKYYEYSFKNISKGEGGLSSFRICYDDDNSDIKESNNNSIYFIVSGKKTLLPPSYKNYIQWNSDNCFYLIKPFTKIKYKFIIHHMKRQIINCIKISKDGTFIIVGYSNGIIEKYKLTRIWGPKFDIKKTSNKKIPNNSKNVNTSSNTSKSSLSKESNDMTASKDDNILYENLETKNKEEFLEIENAKRKKLKSVRIKKGLFNSLFGTKNRKKTQIVKNPKKFENNYDNNNNDSKDEEENKKIIEIIEKNIKNTNINNSSISNEIFFDTQIPISTTNIINSDCIILNNNTGKFIQYNGYPLYFDITTNENRNEQNKVNNNNQKNNINNNNKINISGYEIYSNNKNQLNNIINKENHQNLLSKHYVIFLINSSNRIFSEISLIEICEPYSFMLVVDKLNNLYTFNFNNFDLIRYIDCSKYFYYKIKYISICPFTGDFILASSYKVVLMSINGVFITQLNNIKSKINHCFITSNHKTCSDLFLFSANEDGNLIISKLKNNLNNVSFDLIKSRANSQEEDIESINSDELNNKYNQIKIKNILSVYNEAYQINPKYNENNDICKNFWENIDNLSIIFETKKIIKCSEYPIKYIKLSQDLSTLLCIDSKNNIIKLNYEEFFKDNKSNKDCKNCDKSEGILTFKTICSICGKKLCPNCKIEKIISECSLKTPKPICSECFESMTQNNQNIYDF